MIQSFPDSPPAYKFNKSILDQSAREALSHLLKGRMWLNRAGLIDPLERNYLARREVAKYKEAENSSISSPPDFNCTAKEYATLKKYIVLGNPDIPEGIVRELLERPSVKQVLDNHISHMYVRPDSKNSINESNFLLEMSDMAEVFWNDLSSLSDPWVRTWLETPGNESLIDRCQFYPSIKNQEKVEKEIMGEEIMEMGSCSCINQDYVLNQVDIFGCSQKVNDLAGSTLHGNLSSPIKAYEDSSPEIAGLSPSENIILQNEIQSSYDRKNSDCGSDCTVPEKVPEKIPEKSRSRFAGKADDSEFASLYAEGSGLGASSKQPARRKKFEGAYPSKSTEGVYPGERGNGR